MAAPWGANSGPSGAGDPRVWGEQAALSLGERLKRAEFKRLAAETLEIRQVLLAAGRTLPATPSGGGSSSPAGPADGEGAGAPPPFGGTTPVPGLPDDDYAARFAAAKRATDELFYRWIDIRDVMRTGVGGAIDAIGAGIAGQLVDGTYEWEQAWKAVLKEIIAVTAKMLIVQGIAAALAALTGGASQPGAGGAGELIADKLNLPIGHQGGLLDWPRHHFGALQDDERPAILQVGEFVMRREAVESIGAGRLWEMNRTGRAPTEGDAFHINISVNAPGGEADPRRLAEAIAEPLIEILQREKSRNREII